MCPRTSPRPRAGYRLAAELDNAIALNILGLLYCYGLGVDQDEAQAVQHFLASAERDYAGGQGNIGHAYRVGLGVDQDDAQALHWLQLAAAGGRPLGLARLYDAGQGVPQDFAEAARLYRLAADQGHPRGQSNLGLMYRKGDGVPQDDAEAARLIRLAADQGYATRAIPPCRRLPPRRGRDEESGRGRALLSARGRPGVRNRAPTAEDQMLAARQRAAKRHHDPATAGGRAVTARAALTSKDAGALYARALRSLYGEGVRRNRAQAARWYRRAAQAGRRHGRALP